MGRLNPSKHCIITTKPNARGDIYLVHGLLSNKQTFTTLQRILSRHTPYNIIACDARDHGSRSRETSEADWAGTVEDYRQLISDRHPNHAILIGHSMGSVVAYNLAARDPTRFTKVFLLSSVNNLKGVDQSPLREFFKTLPRMPNTLSMPSPPPEFHILHSDRDPIVPLSQGLANQHQLHVTDDRTLIIKQITPIGAHANFYNNPEVAAYLVDAINK